MNLGTAVVSLLLIVIVVAIIRSIVKDKRAGKNVGCGSCKSCAHATTSSHSFKKTSHVSSSSCPSCAHVDKMLADLEKSTDSIGNASVDACTDAHADTRAESSAKPSTDKPQSHISCDCSSGSGDNAPSKSLH